MMNEAVRELLGEASALTQALGRRIGSLKNDPEDLEFLCEALHSIERTVETAKKIMIDSYHE